MELLIPCGVVARLSRLNRTLPPSENREWLKSLFVECRDGHVFVGATNSIFAAIERVGVTTEPDGFIVLAHHAVVLDAVVWCDPDAKVTVQNWPELNFCSVAAPVNGAAVNGDAAIRDPEAIKTLSGWREWLPDALADAPGRSMFMNVDGMAALCASSPSGRVVFPRVIDAKRAIIVRDTTSPDWLGCFFAQPDSGIFLDGAKLPDWIGK